MSSDVFLQSRDKKTSHTICRNAADGSPLSHIAHAHLTASFFTPSHAYSGGVAHKVFCWGGTIAVVKGNIK